MKKVLRMGLPFSAVFLLLALPAAMGVFHSVPNGRSARMAL